MNSGFKNAFTLVELLVVIAIIGILSGLIIVGMSSSTNSARIAKAQIFASSIRDSMLMSLVSEWKFDGSGIADGSAVTAGTTYLQDSWGGENATIGVAPLVYSGSNCIYGSCLGFTGSQYLNVADDAVFNFGAQMTAMVWVKAPVSTERAIIAQYEYNPYRASWLLVSRDTGIFRVYLSDDGTNNGGHLKHFSTPSPVFDGNWHYVGFTWNAGAVTLYVDGQTITPTVSGTLTTNSLFNSTTNLTMGAYFNTGNPIAFLTGSIDEVRLYNTVMPAYKINEQYFLGLNKLFANRIITIDDYQKKIEAIDNKMAFK